MPFRCISEYQLQQAVRYGSFVEEGSCVLPVARGNVNRTRTGAAVEEDDITEGGTTPGGDDTGGGGGSNGGENEEGESLEP